MSTLIASNNSLYAGFSSISQLVLNQLEPLVDVVQARLKMCLALL